MKNGRRKGLAFENEICHALSLWLAPEHTPENATVYDLPFRRRSTSIMPVEGHWKGKGDILHRPFDDICCPFAFECKKVEGWSLDGAANEKWPVFDWWDQAVSQAKKMNLHPVMLFSRNRQPVRVLVQERVAECLRLRPTAGPYLTLQTNSLPRVVIVLLPDLVQASARDVRRAAKLVPQP